MTVNEIRNRISRLQTDAYWEKRHYGSVSERTTEKIKALQEELAFMKDKNAKIRAQKARTRRGEQQAETYTRNLEVKRFRLNTNVIRDPMTGRFVSWDDEIYGLVYDDETIAWYEEDAFAAEAHSRWIATCVVSGSDGLSDAAIAYQELLNLKDAMLPTAFDELMQPELYNENHVDDLAYADELEVEKKLMESFDAEVQWNVYESVFDDEPSESDFAEYDEENDSPAYDEEQDDDVFRTDNPWDDDYWLEDEFEHDFGYIQEWYETSSTRSMSPRRQFGYANQADGRYDSPSPCNYMRSDIRARWMHAFLEIELQEEIASDYRVLIDRAEQSHDLCAVKQYRLLLSECEQKITKHLAITGGRREFAKARKKADRSKRPTSWKSGLNDNSPSWTKRSRARHQWQRNGEKHLPVIGYTENDLRADEARIAARAEILDIMGEIVVPFIQEHLDALAA